MKVHSSLIGMLIVCLTASILSSCSRSPRVTFYTLNSATRPETYAVSESPFSLEIGPITIPEMYDRPQLVVRTDSNRVELLENHRWAAPLKSEIQRVIAGDLEVMLKPARVASYPQNAGMDADFRVLVDIQRFDVTGGKGVDLEALWSLSRNGELLKRGKTSVRESVSGSSTDAMVAAYGRALGTVSRDIAQAVTAGNTASR
jgi:uncharacterized lipoprotein YmbA